MSVIGDLEVVITATSTGLIAGLKSAESSLLQFIKQIETGQLSLKTFSMGTTLLGTGLLTFAGVIGGTALKSATEWNQQLVTTGNNAGMTSKEIADMGNTVMDMSAKLGASKGDLLNAYMYIHDMGFAGKDASGMLEVATKEALATGSSISDTASVLATVMHEFGVPIKNASSTLDQLHAAAASARMTMQDFVSSFGPVGAQASAIGIPMNQAAAAMAALTRNGFDASMSATQVRDMLLHMMAPSKSAESALLSLSGAASTTSKSHKDFSYQILDTSAKLQVEEQKLKEAQSAHKVSASVVMEHQLKIKELGHTIEDLGQKQNQSTQGMSVQSKAAVNLAYDFSQQGLQAKGLVGVLNDLKIATGGNAEEMNKLIPNLRGGLGALVLVGKGHQDMIDILKKEEESVGSVQSSYERYAQTTAAQSKQLSESFNNVSIALGTALIPVVNEFLKAILPIIQNIAVWTNQHPKLAAGILVAVGVLGALLVAVGVVSATIAFLFNPITLAIVGFGILAAAITSMAKDFVEQITGVKRSWQDFFGFIGGIINGIVGMFNHLADVAKNALSHLDPKAKHSPSLVEQVADGVEQIKKSYQSIAGMQISAPSISGLSSSFGGMGGSVYSPSSATNYSYSNVNQPNTSITNTFNIRGEENAVGFAEYMGFQLEHLGVV